MFDFLSYRAVTKHDAPLLRQWRTAPEITRDMLTDVNVTVAEQEAWIERCEQRDDFTHRIVCIHGRDVGYRSITVRDQHCGIGEIGAYIGEADAPKSHTVYAFLGTLNHAFLTLGLHKLVNHIMHSNDRILKAQAFNGYRHVGVLHDHWLKNGSRYDVHVFEQSVSDWLRFRQKFAYVKDWDGRETDHAVERLTEKEKPQ